MITELDILKFCGNPQYHVVHMYKQLKYLSTIDENAEQNFWKRCMALGEDMSLRHAYLNYHLLDTLDDELALMYLSDLMEDCGPIDWKNGKVEFKVNSCKYNRNDMYHKFRDVKASLDINTYPNGFMSEIKPMFVIAHQRDDKLDDTFQKIEEQCELIAKKYPLIPGIQKNVVFLTELPSGYFEQIVDMYETRLRKYEQNDIYFAFRSGTTNIIKWHKKLLAQRCYESSHIKHKFWPKFEDFMNRYAYKNFLKYQLKSFSTGRHKPRIVQRCLELPCAGVDFLIEESEDKSNAIVISMIFESDDIESIKNPVEQHFKGCERVKIWKLISNNVKCYFNENDDWIKYINKASDWSITECLKVKLPTIDMIDEPAESLKNIFDEQLKFIQNI